MLATSAAAVQIHPFVSKFDIPASSVAPGGVAVDEGTHHVYVVNLFEAIYDFGAGGKPNSAHPQFTGAPGFEPYGLAADNSGGANDGYVYATSLSDGMQQFDPAGVATGVRIEASDIPAAGTPQAGGLPPVVNNGGLSLRGVAVDSGGKVYVSDRENNAIDEFSASGAFIAQVGAGLASSVFGIAVGPSGTIYMATSQGLKALDAEGNCINACVPIDPTPTSGVAVDSLGNVLATITESGGSSVSSVKEFDSSGSLLSVSGAEQVNNGFGVAIDRTTGNIYAGDLASLAHGPEVKPDVKVFGPLITLPDASTGVATVSGQSVTLHGDVGADGGPDATCLFQYVEQTGFAESGFAGASTAPCSPAGPFSGPGTTSVQASLLLNAGTTYRYRLLASSSAGSTPGAAVAFTTAGPSVISEAIGAVSESGVTLEAAINPNGRSTGYRFEYVSQAQFEASGFDEAVEVPAGGEAIGSGSGDVNVSQRIEGLIPGAVYHFRAVALDDLEEVATGADFRFATYAPAGPALPDGRAYEQASPVDKNGANVEAGTNAVQSAPDGSAITFFSNAGLPGGEGAQNFPLFLAQRSPAPAWSTQGLLPPASTGPRGKVMGWGEGLRWAFDGNFPPGGTGTFYARDSASRSLTQIATGLLGPASNFDPTPAFAGAAGSEESIVVFEDMARLLPSAKAGKPNVYIWDRGSGQLWLGGALNSGQAPSQGAFAGPYNWFEGSEGGGAASSYYTHAGHAISEDASRLFFTSANDQQLYMRVNPTQPQSPLAAGACSDPTLACTIKVSASQASIPDPAGEQPAAFAEATPDGHFAFFMSAGKLTDDATEGRQLYRYDTETGDLLNLTASASDTSADVQGLVGISEDGSYTYFAANRDPSDAGATPGTCRNNGAGGGRCAIYAWHNGAIIFIASVAPTNGTGSDLVNWIPNSRVTSNPVEKSSRVDRAGTVLLFQSTLQLTAYQNDGHVELYRSELTPGGRTLLCVSCNPTNAAPDGDASLQGVPEKLTAPRAQAPVLTRNLSIGGNRIFFDSPDQLVANDDNGVNDVYEWESNGTGSCQGEGVNGGCLYLISSGQSPLPSYFADASADGQDAFIFTTQGLVAQDRDQIQDVYDARVHGGIPAQNQLPPDPCFDESTCLGAVPAPPPFTEPGTPNFVGPGNGKPVKCKKGHKKAKRKGKAVCVKVAHKHKKAQGKPKRGGGAGK